MVELVCAKCSCHFMKEKKEYDRHIKQGRDKWYCSLGCCGKVADTYSPFRPYYQPVKRNAINRGISFSLTLESLKALWEKQNGICPYTGISMKLGKVRDGRIFLPDWASLDRIDSSKGYEPGNVQFVCLFINYGKNGFSHEKVVEFLSKIK